MLAPVVLASALTVAGCTDLILDPPPPADARSVYDELWALFSEHYAPFAERGVDWGAAGARHRPAPGAGEDELFAAATALLGELDDGHVTLAAPGRSLFVSQRDFRERTYHLHLDVGIISARMVQGPFRLGDARFGLLPDDVAYVWVGSMGDAIPDLDRLVEFLSFRSAVIVDLRHNDGGDFRNGFELAERLADRRRLAFSTETKVGPGPGQLGQHVEWHVEPRGTPRVGGPVVVLTNRLTNSAAERTLMALREFDHVTVLGTRTAGNHGEKVGRELSNGWRVSLVPQVVTAADGASYEGRGIPPDIEVENSEAEILAGLDRQFEAALAFLVDTPASRVTGGGR